MTSTEITYSVLDRKPEAPEELRAWMERQPRVDAALLLLAQNISLLNEGALRLKFPKRRGEILDVTFTGRLLEGERELGQLRLSTDGYRRVMVAAFTFAEEATPERMSGSINQLTTALCTTLGDLSVTTNSTHEGDEPTVISTALIGTGNFSIAELIK